MAENGAAVSFVIIILTLFACGIIYMFTNDLFDTFHTLGIDAGSDASTSRVIYDAWHIYTPVVLIFGIIFYGYRRSKVKSY